MNRGRSGHAAVILFLSFLFSCAGLQSKPDPYGNGRSVSKDGVPGKSSGDARKSAAFKVILSVLDIPPADLRVSRDKAFRIEPGLGYVNAFFEARLDTLASLCGSAFVEKLPLSLGLSRAAESRGNEGTCTVKIMRWGLVVLAGGKPGVYAEIETVVRGPDGKRVFSRIESGRVVIVDEDRPSWESAWIGLKLCVEGIAERTMKGASGSFRK